MPAEVGVSFLPRGYGVVVDGHEIGVEGMLADDGLLDARLDGRKVAGRFWFGDGHGDLFLAGDRFAVALPDPFAEGAAEAQQGALTAPMPGIVRAVLVAPGERVEKGRALVVMEAMKMEHTIRAPADGVVEAVNCAEGAMAEAGTALVSFVPEAKE